MKAVSATAAIRVYGPYQQPKKGKTVWWVLHGKTRKAFGSRVEFLCYIDKITTPA